MYGDIKFGQERGQRANMGADWQERQVSAGKAQGAFGRLDATLVLGVVRRQSDDHCHAAMYAAQRDDGAMRPPRHLCKRYQRVQEDRENGDAADEGEPGPIHCHCIMPESRNFDVAPRGVEEAQDSHILGLSPSPWQPVVCNTSTDYHGSGRAGVLWRPDAEEEVHVFESAEVGHFIDKKAYREQAKSLRAALLEAQTRLRELGKFPVVLLISGVDGAGKSETIATLYEWMDPRYLSTLAFSEPSDEERERPFMWRYWRALPPKGRIGIFSGSWYSIPIAQRIARAMSRGGMDNRLDQINRFESMLVNEGALVLKFWFHLSKDGQKKRLKKLESDPRTAWRVTKLSWDRLKTYDDLQEVAGHVLRVTNTAWAPWIIVDGTDDNYRDLRVGKALLDALEHRLAEVDVTPKVSVAPPITPRLDNRNVITALDLSLSLPEKKYELELAQWQGKLSELSRHKRFSGRSLILVFEGMDAAGKGGAIRRIAAALDPRQYQIIPIAAPTDEERAQPYLWRFWRHIPRQGRVTMFDRSWYGRVLVERIEGFCSEEDWLRAYSEINDFEHEQVENGAVVIKFWLQIDEKEQLKRFKEREEIDHKRFKITAEDWRNREKWDAYQNAAVDMIDRTSTGQAPWIAVEANDKNFARVKIMKALCRRLEDALEAGPAKDD